MPRRSKTSTATLISSREKGFLALGEELQQKVVNINCSPERQLKLEPSTVAIQGSMDEISYLEGQKPAPRLSFLAGKRDFWLWVKSYNKK